MKTFLIFLCLVAVRAVAQQTSDPLVLHIDVPRYPPLARAARVEGNVVVSFAVKGGNVQNAEAKSGHPLLVAATIENIKSWRFFQDVNGTFTTTFDYRIKGHPTSTRQNPKIEMRLPAFVRVTATPPPLMVSTSGSGPTVLQK